MSEAQKAVTPERIIQMSFAYAAPLMLEAAIHHRVFDVLDEEAKTLEQVSAETGASVRGLKAVMNGLVALDFLAKDGEHYRLTPESAAFLVSTKPSFQGGILRHTSSQLMPKWLGLNEIVRTGKPSVAANEETEGTKFFQQFVADIFPLSYVAAQALASALRIAESQKPVSVLDVAAGSGVWSIALAQASPHVRATIVDWAGVIPVARQMTERFRIANQFRFVEGDILEADFGEGHDIATLGHIIHSEGEERAALLIAKVFDALARGGTIVIAEMLVNEERTGPPFSTIFGVNMLVNTERGDVFSFGEISRWLKDAGFTNARTLDAPGPSPLILATKSNG